MKMIRQNDPGLQDESMELHCMFIEVPNEVYVVKENRCSPVSNQCYKVNLAS